MVSYLSAECKAIISSKVHALEQVVTSFPTVQQKEAKCIIARTFAVDDISGPLQIVEALKEVVHYCMTRQYDLEGVRTTLLSAICAPRISTRTISEHMEIFQNSNHTKLQKFRERTQTFIAGSSMC